MDALSIAFLCLVIFWFGVVIGAVVEADYKSPPMIAGVVMVAIATIVVVLAVIWRGLQITG